MPISFNDLMNDFHIRNRDYMFFHFCKCMRIDPQLQSFGSGTLSNLKRLSKNQTFNHPER